MEITDLMMNGFKILFSRSRYQHFLPKRKCEKGKYHVEACEKCRLSAPTPQHLLNQKLHLTKIPQVILMHIK